MKTIASITILLLLSACASSSGIVDERLFQCGPGQDIEIRAGLDNGSINSDVGGQLTYLVEIANNSHNDVVVKSVRITPAAGTKIPGVEPAAKAFDQLVAAGEDHVFAVPTGRIWIAEYGQPLVGRNVQFHVSISLSNGDSYRCSFESEWR